MLLRCASDLHLEGFLSKDISALAASFLPPNEQDAEAVLVLAGDISSKPEQLLEFINEVSPRFTHTLFVMGNHEYYRQHYQNLNSELQEYFSHQPNVTAACGDVRSVQVNDVTFILGTLWGDGGETKADLAMVNFAMNDFRLIRFEDRVMQASDMKLINSEQARAFKQGLQESSGKKVCVSHHMPSYRLCHPRFGSGYNGGFACNLDPLLAGDTAPQLWIHGHTHDTIDTQLWNTRVICNPRGYRGEWDSPHNTYSDVFVEV